MVDASEPALERLGIQFQDMEQQHKAATQGMWVFVATEALFLGALFLAYAMLRYTYPHDFGIASHEISVAYGTVNTVVLTTSSLFMGLAIRAAREGRRSRLFNLLIITALLGSLFLAIKGFEYAYDLRHHSVPGAGLRIEGQRVTPPMHLFFFLYWIMTAVHAVHLIIAIGAVLYLAARTALGHFSREYHNPVEVVGIYWHFVDIVWLFIYPTLYLAGLGVK